MTNSFNRIESRSEVLNGKPCIKGTRISVQLILEWMGSGASADEIAKQHPIISREDVLEAIRYASKFDQNEFFIELKIA